jgi:hypothetical protein
MECNTFFIFIMFTFQTKIYIESIGVAANHILIPILNQHVELGQCKANIVPFGEQCLI